MLVNYDRYVAASVTIRLQIDSRFLRWPPLAIAKLTITSRLSGKRSNSSPEPFKLDWHVCNNVIWQIVCIIGLNYGESRRKGIFNAIPATLVYVMHAVSVRANGACRLLPKTDLSLYIMRQKRSGNSGIGRAYRGDVCEWFV